MQGGHWLEKYGGASLQNSWTLTALDSSVSCGQKRAVQWLFEENQVCSEGGVIWLPDIQRDGA